MSKKAKKKKTATRAAKRATKRGGAKTVRAARGAVRLMAAEVAPSRTSAATIFVYDNGSGVRVRTSPQLLTCAPGYVEWTVVNLTKGEMPDLEITWQAGGPWGGASIPIRNGNARLSLAGANEGRFKYNVTCGGYTEDPEIEYPEN